jgi:hypothetical protein
MNREPLFAGTIPAPRGRLGWVSANLAEAQNRLPGAGDKALHSTPVRRVSCACSPTVLHPRPRPRLVAVEQGFLARRGRGPKPTQRRHSEDEDP